MKWCRLHRATSALSTLFIQEGDGARKGGFATLELPGKTANRHTSILQFRRADLPTHIFDVDTVMGEEGVVRQLVGAIGKELIDPIGAKFCFALGAHFLPLLERATTQEATDGQIHWVVGRNHI